MENRHLPNLGENDFFCLVDEGDLMKVWTLQQTKAEKKERPYQSRSSPPLPLHQRNLWQRCVLVHIGNLIFIGLIRQHDSRDPKNPFFFYLFSLYFKLFSTLSTCWVNGHTPHVLQRGRLRDIHGTLQCEPIIDFIKLLFWNASAHVACTIALFINKREKRKEIERLALGT